MIVYFSWKKLCFKDVRALNFPRTDFVKTLTAVQVENGKIRLKT